MVIRRISPLSAGKLAGALYGIMGLIFGVIFALIGRQRIVLRLDAQRLTLATDGLGPFTVADSEAAP